ncbi:MAG: hypothetical protein AAGJ74_02195 [Pseudomonadota bacterium]
MNDKASLEAKLAAVAEAGLPGAKGRALRGDSHTALMAAVLREIDALVLPRTLTIDGAGGRRIRCEVTGRRLLRVYGDAGGAHRTLEGRDLDGGEDTLAGELGAYFEAAFGDLREIHARVSPLEREVGPADPGISAGALADAWGLTLAGPIADGAVIDSFLAELGEATQAWRLIGGDDCASAGDSAALDRLEGMAAEALLPPDDSGVMTALALSDGGDTVIAARADGMTLLAALPPGSATHAAAVWRRVAG